MSTREELAERYAAAVLQIAQQRGIVERITGDLQLLDTCMREHPELPGLLSAPSIDRERRYHLLSSSFGTAVHETTLKLFRVLIRRGRIMLLPELYGALLRIRDRMEQLTDITVTSARPLQPAQQATISENLRRQHEKTGEITFEVDARLVAGLKLQVGEKVIDHSIRAGLGQLKKALMQSG